MDKCIANTKKNIRCKNDSVKDETLCKLHMMLSKCTICLNNSSKLFKLDCSHSFHLNCLKDLVKLECPMCRAEITNLPDDIKNRIKDNIIKHKEEVEEQDRQEIINSLEEFDNLPILIEIEMARDFLINRNNLPSELFPEIDIANSEGINNLPRGVVFQRIVTEVMHLIQCMTEEIDLVEREDDEDVSTSSD